MSIVTLEIFLSTITAVAVAPLPSPEIVIAGAEVYNPPASNTSIDVIVPVASVLILNLPAHLSVDAMPPPT